MEFVDSRTIKIDKELNELDKFVLEFLKIVEKHAKYVIISGYVPILFGRSRATEDVDIFIEELPRKRCIELLSELGNSGWNCMTIGLDEMFSYLDNNTAIRFYKKISAIPNIEVKFARKKFDKHTMADRLKIIIGKDSIFVPTIEEQIIYKKIVLGSDKDIEDARHLEEAFKDRLDKNRLRQLENDVRSGKHEI